MKCSSVPQSTKNKYVVDTGFGLTVDILCGSGGTGGTAPATDAGQGNSKLKQDAAAIDCATDPCTIADAEDCCYDPRFDQRSDGTTLAIRWIWLPTRTPACKRSLPSVVRFQTGLSPKEAARTPTSLSRNVTSRVQGRLQPSRWASPPPPPR